MSSCVQPHLVGMSMHYEFKLDKWDFILRIRATIPIFDEFENSKFLKVRSYFDDRAAVFLKSSRFLAFQYQLLTNTPKTMGCWIGRVSLSLSLSLSLYEIYTHQSV